MDNSKESLKNALIQALSEKYSEELEKCCEESAQYSYRHHRRMCTISGAKLQIPVYIIKVKRRVIAALITAAALLLIGCTAIVYKEKIGNFFTEVYQDYIRGVFAESEGLNKEFINEYYTLTYVPEGYEVVENKTSKALARSIWRNKNGSELILKQTTIGSGSYFMDNDSNTYSTIEGEEYIIYVHSVNDTYTCFWSNNEYEFSLTMNDTISEEEIIKIILNIELASK